MSYVSCKVGQLQVQTILILLCVYCITRLHLNYSGSWYDGCRWVDGVADNSPYSFSFLTNYALEVYGLK